MKKLLIKTIGKADDRHRGERALDFAKSCPTIEKVNALPSSVKFCETTIIV
jgi:hypothetical protein